MQRDETWLLSDSFLDLSINIDALDPFDILKGADFRKKKKEIST